jgi:hypothetical protein
LLQRGRHAISRVEFVGVTDVAIIVPLMNVDLVAVGTRVAQYVDDCGKLVLPALRESEDGQI